MADGTNVDELLLGLASMGFEFEDCQLAVEAGNSTLESAVEWLIAKRSNPSHDASKPSPEPTVSEASSQSQVPSEEASTSSDNVQSSAQLSSRYTVSEEHQKAKEQFMEKERENARMEAKRRKLMEKRARQEILQQIAEDKIHRGNRKATKPPAHPATTQTASSSGEHNESLQHNKQCLLQIRGPTGHVQRQAFPPDAKLQDVVTFICSQYHLNSGNFDLLQPFPHRLFTVAEMTLTLVDLGLSPGGSLVVKKRDLNLPSATSGQGFAEVNPENACAMTSRTADRPENIVGMPSNTGPDREYNRPSHRHDDDDSDIDDANEEHQDVNPPIFDRSPPPELEDHLRAPLEGLNPNVLGMGGIGMQNFVSRGHGHMWGEGMRLGAVQHNPHAIEPVLRAQTPGESAVRRLEMRQHQQPQPEAGPSQVTQEEPPLLHRDVQRLEDLCINHVSHRLPGHQNPLTTLGMLPHDLCDKILTHLMKNKALTPKAMQAFIHCGLRHVKLDCYSLVTNELLIALRLHRHLTHLSLRACPLITDKALEAVAVLKRLKSLNISQCAQLTDKCFFHIKELPSLVTLQMDMTKITDRGVCHFLDNAACCPNLVHLSFSGTNLTDSSLAAMSGLKALKILAVSNTKITSLDVVHHLHQLESLNISHCTGICDNSLTALMNHPSLVSLNLLATNISDDGLCHLQGLKLSSLKLPNRLNITDKGVYNIQGLPLVALDLSDYIHITDSGVHCIAHMTRLTQLSLSNTKLTDDGMKSLAALTELEELNVDRTVITDEGCAVLSCFPHLRILGLSSTRISNKLLLNGTLNHCKNLARLNLSRTRVSNKRLAHLVLPLLSQLNLDWTRVTSDCRTLLTGCPSLKALRTNNCTPPSQQSDDSDDDQEQQ
ncbi:uncharacterized protein LOC144660692 [Oculina patagonica]